MKDRLFKYEVWKVQERAGSLRKNRSDLPGFEPDNRKGGDGAAMPVNIFNRVGQGPLGPFPPLERCMTVSRHTAQASQKATLVGQPGSVTSFLHRT